jgi:predicted nucleic acid-binding protein
MSLQAFLNTNVLVYAAAGRLSDPAEYTIAKRIVEQEEFIVSPLVLGEFYAAVRKPQRELMPALQTRWWIEKWMSFCLINVDTAIIGMAAHNRERYKIQLWDAAHIATAERLGLTFLYSEDMSHGQKYGSVTVINPFKGGFK